MFDFFFRKASHEIMKNQEQELCLQDLMDWYSGSIIHYACRNGLLKIVKELIECEADLDVFDEDKKTPLHWMAIEGNAESAKVLIENGQM